MHPNPLEIKPGRIFVLRCVRKSEHTIVYAPVRGRLRDTRGGVGPGEEACDALMISLRCGEAIHDPSGSREGGGGDGSGMQASHTVIVRLCPRRVLYGKFHLLGL